jgi:hypothetical protein
MLLNDYLHIPAAVYLLGGWFCVVYEAPLRAVVNFEFKIQNNHNVILVNFNALDDPSPHDHITPAVSRTTCGSLSPLSMLPNDYLDFSAVVYLGAGFVLYMKLCARLLISSIRYKTIRL